jgi:hypothetical protein
LYAAVPLDGKTYNNAILVYNLTTKNWEGIWTADWLRLEAFIQVVEDGRKKLAFVNGTGGELRVHWWAELSDADQQSVAQANYQIDIKGVTDGGLFVMGAGKQDVAYGYSSWIKDEILTRGYKLAPLQQVQSLRATLDLETWNPRFDVFIRRAGRSTETTVANDVRRGFEREVELVFQNDLCALLAYPPMYTGGGWVYIGSVSNRVDFSYFQTGQYLLTYFDGPPIPPGAGDPYAALRTRPVGKGFVGVTINAAIHNPAYSRKFVATLTNNDTGQSVQSVIDVAGTSTNPFYFNELVDLYPTAGYTLTTQALDGLTPALYDGSNLSVYQLDLSTVVHSRRQRLFGQPQVLWSEGSAPAELNGRGHDDYAWRVGAGIGSGVVLGATQRRPHVYRIDKRGEFLQVRIANDRGYSALHGVSIHGQEGNRGNGNRAG